ncbi:MAG: NUDIX hydrolase, partial [Acidaminococcaceae bacterium]|nr:NUDIX hydrolase [Acidaminococcaceae bacterium]
MIKKFHDSNLNEIRISGEDIYNGVLLHVKKDKVKLPNGNESGREYIRHPGAVAVVPVLDDGRIVLVKQCRYPLDTVMWEIPAGKLDHGAENIEDCARRELSEETGYEAKQWRFLCSIATTPGFSDEVIHLFEAR